MKTKAFAGAVILLLSATHIACAVEPEAHSSNVSPSKTTTQTTSSSQYHAYTLDEARKNAHAYTDKLDKMTPAEWDAMQKQRTERMKRWKNMTPKERAARSRSPGILARPH
jgi:hypothetical protein